MRDKKRILIVGAFGFTTNQLDGQTVKTRNIKDLIIKNGDFQVYQFDTLEVKRNPLGLFLFLWRLMQCHTLILIPCLNNLTYIFPVVFYLSKIFRYLLLVNMFILTFSLLYNILNLREVFYGAL